MFDQIWSKIERFQGEEFRTIRGLPFSYSVKGNQLFPDRQQTLSKGQVEKVWAMGPLKNPHEIKKRNSGIRGTSYIWAILHDPRIAG